MWESCVRKSGQNITGRDAIEFDGGRFDVFEGQSTGRRSVACGGFRNHEASGSVRQSQTEREGLIFVLKR